MKIILTVLVAFAVTTGASAQIDHDCKVEIVKLSEAVETTETYDVYGDAWDAKGSPVLLTDAISSLVEGEERNMLIIGSVSEVCQTKGCWMVLTEDGTSARVHFKDYEFFVPTDIAGRQVEIVGNLKEKTISEEQARHYAEDAHHENPESIEGSQREYTFIASSVKVYK